MKTLALSLFTKLLKMVGLKTVLRYAWKKGIYPRLKVLADNSEEQWDNKLLEFVDANVYKVIDKI